MRTFVLTFGLIVASLVPAVASAQNRINTGTGNTGTGNTGTSGFGNTGSSGFGSTGTSGTGGSSGFGSTGSSGFGSTGIGGQTGQGGAGQAGFGGQNQLGGNANGGILGRNTNPNQLLGRNIQNAGVGANNNFGGGRGGGGNRGNNGNNALNGGGGNGGNANQAPIVRPRLEVGFNFPKAKTDNIQIALETRMTRLSVKTPAMKSVMVAVENKGEVVLRGAVKSESEAKLAVELLRLEPGVESIRSELTFPSAETPDE